MAEFKPMSEGTLLLRPRPIGCAWVEEGEPLPRCPLPADYLVTCAVTNIETQACALHTATMRAQHPDWIGQVTSR